MVSLSFFSSLFPVPMEIIHGSVMLSQGKADLSFRIVLLLTIYLYLFQCVMCRCSSRHSMTDIFATAELTKGTDNIVVVKEHWGIV